ncbi:hypothetical protein APHAL10511_006791 [Amanita phalloides]|nr:hypothetical protein APHAL10511_006791 [Amanita phalloides]
MIRFHSEIAAALAVSVLGSSVTFFLTRRRGGKIQLPVHEDESLSASSDPFDVATPDDIANGYPLDDERFWKQVFRRKLVLTLNAAFLVVLSAICIGYVIANSERVDTVIYSIHLGFATYLLIICARSLKQSSTNDHFHLILHVTTLSMMAALTIGTAAVIPTTLHPVVSSVNEDPSIQVIWHTALGLYAVMTSVAITTPLGPPLHYPPENIYTEKTVTAITNSDQENVCGVVGCSVLSHLLFSYATKVVWLGNVAESLDIGDLPIVPGYVRATRNFSKMRQAIRGVHLHIGSWRPKLGSGWNMIYRLLRANYSALLLEAVLSMVSAGLYYLPTVFLQRLLRYFEVDPNRENSGWGWAYVIGLIGANVATHITTGQLFSVTSSRVQVCLRSQLNSVLFAKTLVRKNIASASPPSSGTDDAGTDDDYSTKAQVMTLMTTDVDRISDLSWHLSTLIDAPIEVVIGTIFLYKLLGVSCFYGLAVTCLFLPLNHYASKVVTRAQEDLMKSRDERVSLMNEVLGAIRMLKFMAWERSFEARVLRIREKELKHQKLNYTIEILWNVIWSSSPIVVTIVAFFHFTVIRHQSLTPSIAFTSILVFTEMRYALNALPETFINILQALVSLQRIEKYLLGTEVSGVPPLERQNHQVALQSCTITWPQDRSLRSAATSVAATPRQKFVLIDLTCEFPEGQLSLICGKLGSGKSLLLLSLLGEADILTGQLTCPRSPPDSLASFIGKTIPQETWIIDGLCAYVPQAVWLRNATIKENILFDLPYDEERYMKTLEVCALLHDLEILEDGDESEIGERGVNLSGGQKARVSLARAIYSRASILLLDDVLSAVDAQTAHHLYWKCLRGDLACRRTIILVSHHVQLCARGASYVVALNNGRLEFAGGRDEFLNSEIINDLVHSTGQGKEKDVGNVELGPTVEEKLGSESGDESEPTSTIVASPSEKDVKRKTPRKLVEEEKRAIGHIDRQIWGTYIWACGNGPYWAVFSFTVIAASLSPVIENNWLRYWSSRAGGDDDHDALFYVGVYTVVTMAGVIIGTLRWVVLYSGSIQASTVLYKRLLESVLFANIRFHDTVNRGRLLNRFGKDFEGIDSTLSDNFGRSMMYFLSTVTSIATVSVVGGLPFILATGLLGVLYWNVAKIYGQTSRDLRRLDSVYKSPLYSIYGESISGVAVLRAFGASTKFLREMLRCVDTSINPYFWMWEVNRWLSIRFNLLSTGIVGAIAIVALLTPSISASFAGFALTFAATVSYDLLFMVRRFVGLEQSMVAIERVKEYSVLKPEGPEIVEPRPPETWPSSGAIECHDLVVRYAPDLPDVLHRISFSVNPGEKIGILGRTGSGKSTLALSLFRFVEPTEGRIMIDGLNISSIGLSDLRSRVTIIPQDPTILSGTLRSTLDVFDEYNDAEIFEALRRVHLIHPEDTLDDISETVNANVFRNLDSVVTEGGENFSTGEKQLLCMARAILKRSKLLVMDEATASVDYATDELIGKTIRREFAASTILTIAHRLRTVIDYDRVLLLDQGHVVEFDRPAVLLGDPSSKFYALCKATGKDEFATLRRMAGI